MTNLPTSLAYQPVYDGTIHIVHPDESMLIEDTFHDEMRRLLREGVRIILEAERLTHSHRTHLQGQHPGIQFLDDTSQQNRFDADRPLYALAKPQRTTLLSKHRINIESIIYATRHLFLDENGDIVPLISSDTLSDGLKEKNDPRPWTKHPLAHDLESELPSAKHIFITSDPYGELLTLDGSNNGTVVYNKPSLELEPLDEKHLPVYEAIQKKNRNKFRERPDDQKERMTRLMLHIRGSIFGVSSIIPYGQNVFEMAQVYTPERKQNNGLSKITVEKTDQYIREILNPSSPSLVFASTTDPNMASTFKKNGYTENPLSKMKKTSPWLPKHLQEETDERIILVKNQGT